MHVAIGIQLVVGGRFVAVDRSSGSNVLTSTFNQQLGLGISNDAGTDFSVPFKQTLNSDLADELCGGVGTECPQPTTLVQEAGLAAAEAFGYADFSAVTA